MAPVIRGNSLYTIVDGPSWTQAEANSVKLGGHLVTINDAAENNWLTTSGIFSGVNKWGIWIGATDRDQEGTWKSSTGQLLGFTNWYSGEPNNATWYANAGEDYGSMALESGLNNGKWADIGNLHPYGDITSGISETPFIQRGNSAYVIVQGPTWEEAEANAIKLGGHLVTINDAAENDWLYGQITNGKRSEWGLWIGATDKISEGIWTDSEGNKLGFNNFYSPEPNNLSNYDSNGEDYAAITTELGANGGKWGDIANAHPTPNSITSGVAEIKLAPNNTPTGTPNVTGTFKVGSTLTIDLIAIKDSDNFTGYTPTFKYSWETSTDGSIWSKLITTDGADNNNTYILTSAEANKKIRGVVSYLDGYGTNEVINSAMSVAIETVTPTYTLTPSASSINEGSTLTTSVATTDVASGTTLYYSLSGTGITATDFSAGSLTGSGTIASNGTFSFSHTLANDLTTEGTETLQVKLFSDSTRLQQVGSTASVSISDTSKAVPYIEINKVTNHPEIPWWWHNMNENASTVEGTQEFNVVHYEYRNAINVNATLLKVGNITTVAMDSGNSSVWGAVSLDKNVEGFSVISGDGDDQVTIKLGTDRGESNFSHLELRLFSGRDSVYIDRISLLDNAVTGGNFIDGGDGIDTVTINDTYDNYELYSSNPIDRNRWELRENQVYRNKFLSSYNSGFTFPDNLRFSDQPAYPQISLFDIEKVIFLDIEVLLDKTSPTYTLTPSASSINEGSTLTTSVATTDVASGTTLYYSLSGTGITATDFSAGSLTGSGTIASNGTFSFSHTLANDLTTEGTETIAIKIFSDRNRLIKVGETNVSIIDYAGGTTDYSYSLSKLSGLTSPNSLVLAFENYQFYNLGGNRQGIQKKGTGAIDEITGISTLTFNDSRISVSDNIIGVFNQVTGKETKDAQMFRLYNASFNRFPDSSGLKYWINEYSKGITDYRNIAESFIISSEFKQRYGASNTNLEFATNMYKNILGRLPDAEGLNYWVSNLNAGTNSRVDVLGGFSESVENKNLFSQVTGFV